jgi:hypothetical protein
MNDDLYRVCRWCKYFNNGSCTNDRAFEADDVDLYPFWEDGTLSEAITEGFKEPKFPQLKQALLESKLSKKAQSEIFELFLEEFEDYKVNCTESIDQSVSKALKTFELSLNKGVSITDPQEFQCKYYF